MKILQIIPNLNSGGAEKFCIQLSNELSKSNEVVLCTLFDIDDSMIFAKEVHQNVKVVSLNKKLGLDIKIFFKLYQLLKKEKPDVIHTHLSALFYSLFIVLFSNVKIIHTIHNLAHKEANRFKINVYRVFFKYFNVTPVSISKLVLKSTKELYGNKFDVMIENGTTKPYATNKLNSVKDEIKSYKHTSNTKILTTIGRIAKQKNQKLLIETVKILVAQEYDVVLLIIGDDPEKDKSLLKELKKYEDERIKFLGLKSNVIDYLTYSDLFCLSSLYEGMPITLLEAMSLGVIPVCTPAGGIVDVIDVNTGFIAKDFSKESLTEAFKQYLKLEQNNLEILKNNLKSKFNSKYSIEITVNQYFEEYIK